MKAIWLVVISAIAVTAVSTLVLGAFVAFSTMLPTVPDETHIHPTRLMGHTVYLSDFLNFAYSRIGWVFLSGFVGGWGGIITYSLLGEREKERLHKIRMDEMSERPLSE
jgi:hypothetical protein